MGERPLPWSATCFVCGDGNPRGLDAKFSADEAGRVRLVTAIDACFEGYGGHVRGGVVTALLDETAGWAATLALHRLCVAVELNITFRRPVPAGTRVVVVGEPVGKEGRFIRARSTLSDADGKVLATAEGRFMPVAETVHDSVMPLLKMPGRPAEPSDI
jgi:uncharacterized protein (TIGR00369 family)